MAFGDDEQSMLLALIAYGDARESRAALDAVPNEFYDSIYRKVHTKFTAFIKQFKTKLDAHVPDIVADLIAANSEQQDLFVTLFQNLEAHWKRGLNADFVLTKARDYATHRAWLKLQKFMAPLLAQAPDSENLAKIDDEYRKTVKISVQNVSTGISLKDREVINEKLKTSTERVYPTGIKPLDDLRFCPTDKQLYLILAVPGAGKSLALLHHLMTPWWSAPADNPVNVVYFPLELEDSDEIKRIFRARGLYAPELTEDKEIIETRFELDKEGRVLPNGFTKKSVKLSSSLAKRDALHEKIATRGEFLICPFFRNKLTVSKTQSTISAIEAKYNIHVNMVGIDYIALMANESRDGSDGVYENAGNLRNIIAQEGKRALVSAQQLNRDGIKAHDEGGKIITSAYIQGDRRLMDVADKVGVLQSTASERKNNLGRLYGEKGRQVAKDFMVVMAQNYAANRFCVSAGLSSMAYDKKAKDES